MVTTVDNIRTKFMTSDWTPDGILRGALQAVGKPEKKKVSERGPTLAAWSTPRIVGRPVERAVDREPEVPASGRFRWK